MEHHAKYYETNETVQRSIFLAKDDTDYVKATSKPKGLIVIEYGSNLTIRMIECYINSILGSWSKVLKIQRKSPGIAIVLVPAADVEDICMVISHFIDGEKVTFSAWSELSQDFEPWPSASCYWVFIKDVPWGLRCKAGINLICSTFGCVILIDYSTLFSTLKLECLSKSLRVILSHTPHVTILILNPSLCTLNSNSQLLRLRRTISLVTFLRNIR